MYKYQRCPDSRTVRQRLPPTSTLAVPNFWVHEFVDGKQTHLSPHGRSPGTLLLRPDCGVGGWLPWFQRAKPSRNSQDGSAHKKKPSVPFIPIAHRIHGTGIFTIHENHKKSTIHVDKYTLRPMDPMGIKVGHHLVLLVQKGSTRPSGSLDMTATLGLSAKTQTWRTKHVESKKPQLEEGFPEYNNHNGNLKAMVQGSETYSATTNHYKYRKVMNLLPKWVAKAHKSGEARVFMNPALSLQCYLRNLPFKNNIQTRLCAFYFGVGIFRILNHHRAVFLHFGWYKSASLIKNVGWEPTTACTGSIHLEFTLLKELWKRRGSDKKA